MLDRIWSALSSIPNKIQELITSISEWFSNLWDTTKNIFSWLGNFFSELLNFFLHIFIPTDEQWEDIGNDYIEMGYTVKSHIPFIGLFSEELKKAQETVSQTDFLVITIPSFSYSGSGGVGVTTGEQKVINVGQVYEPYRSYVRGGLFLIVVGLAFVYIIKYILNFGTTQGSSNVIEGQTSFFDKGGK